MNEELFAKIQKENCWFTFAMFEKLPLVNSNQIIVGKEIWDDETCVQRHIFAMIFGTFGYSENLSKAKSVCGMKIIETEKREPKNKSLRDPGFRSWLNTYAQYCVLYGTILAYQHDYIRSAKFLMNGLKTGAIALFSPYCDFIRYVLSKVSAMPAELAEYQGCGFTADEPMGGPELNGGNLDASVAGMVIPALQGENGEIILAHNGRSAYGTVKRIGSTRSESFLNCIDIYEVLMIDDSNQLKKLRFYFNGYFTRESEQIIRLPKGFDMDFCNPVSSYYKYIR